MYYLTDTGTLHYRRDCGYIAGMDDERLAEVSSEAAPEDAWERLWQLYYGDGPRPDTGDLVPLELVLTDVPAGHSLKIGCLRCLQGAAVKAGWVNSHPPVEGRRHA